MLSCIELYISFILFQIKILLHPISKLNCIFFYLMILLSFQSLHKVIDTTSYPFCLVMLITFDLCKINKLLLLELEKEPSEHACKTFFSYSKLCLISFFTRKVHFLPQKHASRYVSNEFSHHYWQEPFDGDSFVSQSRFDAYAGCSSHCKVWGRSNKILGFGSQ